MNDTANTIADMLTQDETILPGQEITADHAQRLLNRVNSFVQRLEIDQAVEDQDFVRMVRALTGMPTDQASPELSSGEINTIKLELTLDGDLVDDDLEESDNAFAKPKPVVDPRTRTTSTQPDNDSDSDSDEDDVSTPGADVVVNGRRGRLVSSGPNGITVQLERKHFIRAVMESSGPINKPRICAPARPRRR